MSAKQTDRYHGGFRDSAVFDPTQKTAVSVRDGVLEYMGHELGMEPPDRIVTVYRSPATIANAAMRMRGLPITDDHVTLDIPAPSDGGFVSEAEMIDAYDGATSTTIAIRNKLAISDTLLANVEAGKRELSLGYNADLIPHEQYDFEQIDIQPHHLAAVERGRCGPMCSFIDRKPNLNEEDQTMSKLHKAFCDENGAMNLTQIVELATALPEAIKSVPVDQLQELMPALQQIVEASKGVMPEEQTGADAGGEEPPEDPEMIDEEKAAMAEEKEKQFADAVANAAAKQAKEFTDKAIREHAAVIEKARQFLPDDYKFADKATVEIMRDAVATDTTEQFADSELPLAFKMLKRPPADYRQFGDSNPHDFNKLADKEI